MEKEAILALFESVGGGESVHISPEDTEKILTSDIPRDAKIEISTIKDDNIHYVELEGTIGWKEDKISIFMAHNWYRKYWDAPLGMPHHMDLMKRLIEFRQNERGDIEDINLEDEGDWCHLYYTIKPHVADTLKDIYGYGLSVSSWVENIVNEAQNNISKIVTKIAEDYSSFRLIDAPEIIRIIPIEVDNNKKGRLLEELICKLFLEIDGFEIIERLKSETEEVDLVIINKSNDMFWQKESQLIMVECKNWSTRCGKNELVVFKEKLLNRRGRAKIGFFISWNGFTETFSKEDLRSSQGDLLIVPINGSQIVEAIKTGSIQASIEKWWLQAVGS